MEIAACHGAKAGNRCASRERFSYVPLEHGAAAASTLPSNPTYATCLRDRRARGAGASTSGSVGDSTIAAFVARLRRLGAVLAAAAGATAAIGVGMAVNAAAVLPNDGIR